MCKPVSKQVTENYTVCIPYTETRTGTRTVCKPVWKEVSQNYTVSVPYTENRTRNADRLSTVTRHRTRTVCVDQGHWEDRPAPAAAGGCTTLAAAVRDGLRRLRSGAAVVLVMCSPAAGCTTAAYTPSCAPATCRRLGRPTGAEARDLHLQRSPAVQVPYTYQVTLVPSRDSHANGVGLRNGLTPETYQYNVCLTRQRDADADRHRVRNGPVDRDVPVQRLPHSH